MKLRKLLATGVAGIFAITGFAACGSSANQGAVKTGKDQKVTLNFWGWAPGYKEAVDLWNKSHPNTQIKFEETPSTQKIYPKMFTAIKASNAPCLAQVEYGSMPSFVIQNALEDLTPYTKDMGKDFTEDGWKSVEIAGKTYGVPVDTAPIAMIYRKDLFKKYGLTVPKTWEEYRQMAEKVKKEDPSVSLGYFANDPNWFAALARQRGAKWFKLNKDSWSINITDEATQKVAKFWQGMIDDGLIKARESYKPDLYKDMSDGKVLSETFGIWDTAVIAQSVKDGSGKWAVAPMPTWADAPGVYVSAGGSATTVLKGCKNPDRAVEFAHWMSTDPGAVKILIEKGGLWPASLAGLKSPVLDKPVAFYSNEKIYGPFKEISKSIKLDWTWGPLQNQVNKDFEDYMPKVTKDNTIMDTLKLINERAIKDAKAKNLKVE